MTGHDPAVDVPGEVAAELTELADVLQPLDAEAWYTASLCRGWRVREVVAHITLPAHRSAPAVLVQLLLAGFRWNVVADRLARRDAERPIPDLIAALRSPRLHAWRPPGGGAEGALVHAVVHSLDVTIPLGVTRALPPGRMQVVLDTLTSSGSLKHFGIDISGVQLRADDVNWSHGSGPTVRADAQALVLALSGRRPVPVPAD